jgi:hypothetical protein
LVAPIQALKALILYSALLHQLAAVVAQDTMLRPAPVLVVLAAVDAMVAPEQVGILRT